MEPVKPDYDGGCVAGLVPALLRDEPAEWLPEAGRGASKVLLFVLDGLGWSTLQQERERLPNLASLEGHPITTVVPSSTASALTSITTGLTPSEHGLVGYRMRVGGEVMNVLGWLLPSGDEPPDPARVQPAPAFLGKAVPSVTRAQFLGSGFTEASMRGARLIGWRVTSTLVEHCRRLMASQERFVYAYYDGIDLVAHRYGLLNEFFTAELVAADRLVGDLLEALPESAALVVTSDHGQVHVGRKGWVGLEPCDPYLAAYAGDGRFRFMYAKPGADKDLFEAAADHLGERAWIFTKERLLDEGWLGPAPPEWIADRIPEVTAAARGSVALIDPTNPLELNLLSGHGSLTEEEMLVPLVAGRGRG